MNTADTAHDAQADTSSITRRRRPPLDARVALIPISPTLKEKPVPVATARYVLPALAQILTGYTVKAMERKIERGDWAEGKVWVRAPDGRILIDIVGYHKWVEGR
jgi:hypothetical protein